MFVMGGIEVRSANRDERDRVDGRRCLVGREARLWTFRRTQPEHHLVAFDFVCRDGLVDDASRSRGHDGTKKGGS